MLWPLFPSAFILVMLIYFLYSACFIGSMGDIKLQELAQADLNKLGNFTGGTMSLFNNQTITEQKVFTPLDLQPVFQIFNLFMVMWTTGLINAISFTTMAGAFCRWYWSRGDERMRESFPICRSYGRVMQYHFGSMAVGSFILALIRLVRYLLMYLERKTRNAQQNSSCIKSMFKVVHCMLFCFDRCLKYLARQAYIMVAMYGYSFCKASIMAVMLITRNILQIATVNLVNRYVMFLGKLVVLTSCVICSWLWLTYSPDFNGDNALFTMIPTIIVIALFGFSVCTYIFAIYNVGVDTILLCFCQDCMIHENMGDSDTKLFNKGMQNRIKKVTEADREVSQKYAKETELTENLKQ
jgi:choline transporter-like protein 2/4/5